MHTGLAAICAKRDGQGRSTVQDGTSIQVRSPKPRTILKLTRIWLTFIFCFSCVLARLSSAQDTSHTPNKPEFAGSESCRKCHEELYQGWRETRMANVVRDPQKHPEAMLGDFSHDDPNRTFNLGDVAFVYGSRWKQRYFTRRGDDLYPEPAQWDVKHHKWLPYHVPKGTDWWVAFYPDSNFERPTGPLCDGCHSVNYNIETKTVTEWNVGCEKCHGPGSPHVQHPAKANIVEPSNLDFVRANDVCIQCHSQGRPVSNPINQKYFDWPVGFLPGERLTDRWELEDHKLGTTDFFHFADGSAHKNRMQGNDYVQSVMYHRGIRCFDCHQVHSNKNPSNLVRTGNGLCLNCHKPSSTVGPHSSVAEHTHHAEGSVASQCTACHMPRIAQELGDQYVGSHTFRFISPQLTEQFGIPNPCTSCHADKSVKWALGQLRTWQTTSPWRVLQ